MFITSFYEKFGKKMGIPSGGPHKRNESEKMDGGCSGGAAAERHMWFMMFALGKGFRDYSDA
jgi:hypothetical protein